MSRQRQQKTAWLRQMLARLCSSLQYRLTCVATFVRLGYTAAWRRIQARVQVVESQQHQQAQVSVNRISGALTAVVKYFASRYPAEARNNQQPAFLVWYYYTLTTARRLKAESCQAARQSSPGRSCHRNLIQHVFKAMSSLGMLFSVCAI